MIDTHVAHITALQQRVDYLELDLQHKREVISRLLDREAHLMVRLRELTAASALEDQRATGR